MTFAFAAGEVMPGAAEVLASQGVPAGGAVPARVRALVDRALERLARTVAPAGLWSEISRDAFADVYRGEGRNAEDTPLAGIAPRAERLALFAVTLGEAVSREIEAAFAARDPALASLLDGAASAAAERLAAALEQRYRRACEVEAAPGAPPRPSPLLDLGVLRYSPGYCGWHVSGQRRLFEALRPERIGLRLEESCLMKPLKSVSGVLVAGPRRIHVFRDAYPFCEPCDGHGCRERLRDLFAAHPGPPDLGAVETGGRFCEDGQAAARPACRRG